MLIDLIRIAIKVQPNAVKNQVVGLNNGVWRIKIAAPPDKGKANKELVEFLSEVLGLRKVQVSIVRGHTSHNKLVSVGGLTQAEVEVRLSKKK